MSCARKIDNGNPLLGREPTSSGMPPFRAMTRENFADAFAHIMQDTGPQIEAIRANVDKPTFDNTAKPLESWLAGIEQIYGSFFNLTRSNTDKSLDALQFDILPAIAQLKAEVYSDDALFRKIDAALQEEQGQSGPPNRSRVLELLRHKTLRAGATLCADAKKRLSCVVKRQTQLNVQFNQNIAQAENGFILLLESAGALQGLPEFVRTMARTTASENGHPNGYAITLSRSLVEPFLRFSSNRTLREAVFKARSDRGRSPAFNNIPIVEEILDLRREQAKLLGYQSFAHFALDGTMAGEPQTAIEFIKGLLVAALGKAGTELDELRSAMPGGEPMAPWDVAHCLEKMRKSRFDVDAQELQQYFELEQMINAAFFIANKLFGISFVPFPDAVAYHPDVRVWKVYQKGVHIGYFLGDYFARSGKSSGCWTGNYGHGLTEEGCSEGSVVVANVLNFISPFAGQKTVLSLDDVRALFHEFGHAVHALLSRVEYPSLTWLSTSPDYVEFPSQLFEQWFEQPYILERFALNVQSGNPMPAELMRKLVSLGSYGKACATVEYSAAALLDLELHLRYADEGIDVEEFETSLMQEIGIPVELTPRHHAANFTHIFGASSYYASTYYSYLWAEMLAADSFSAFAEAPQLFDRPVADRLYHNIFSSGALYAPREAYRQFRGREAHAASMLRRRGL
jgi:peptidyl-dipeptidase Dcp